MSRVELRDRAKDLCRTGGDRNAEVFQRSKRSLPSIFDERLCWIARWSQQGRQGLAQLCHQGGITSVVLVRYACLGDLRQVALKRGPYPQFMLRFKDHNSVGPDEVSLVELMNGAVRGAGRSNGYPRGPAVETGSCGAAGLVQRTDEQEVHVTAMVKGQQRTPANRLISNRSV